MERCPPRLGGGSGVVRGFCFFFISGKKRGSKKKKGVPHPRQLSGIVYLENRKQRKEDSGVLQFAVSARDKAKTFLWTRFSLATQATGMKGAQGAALGLKAGGGVGGEGGWLVGEVMRKTVQNDMQIGEELEKSWKSLRQLSC